MPLPNPDVIYSIFEFYLNYRASSWKLDINNPAQCTLTPDSHAKRAICMDALTAVRNSYDVSQWIKASYNLYDLECQCIKGDPSWYSWMSNKVGQEKVPLLAKVIRSARAYINSQIRNDSDYIEKVQKLRKKSEKSSKAVSDLTKNIYVEGDITETKKDVEKDKSKLVTLKLKALTENQDYQKSFFISDVKYHDIRSTELNEQSFDDLLANVKNNSRKSPICQALLKSLPFKLDTVPALKFEPKKEEKPAAAPSIKPPPRTSSHQSSSSSHHHTKVASKAPKDTGYIKLDDSDDNYNYKF